MKYATAISPDRMNAAGRVNNPRSICRLPTISSIPAKPMRDNAGSWSKSATCGTRRSFAVPCCRYKNAVTMRSAASARGVHVSKKPLSSAMVRKCTDDNNSARLHYYAPRRRHDSPACCQCPSTANRISANLAAVSPRTQSRCSSHAIWTQLIGFAPACATRSNAARWASSEVPPTASTTGYTS